MTAVRRWTGRETRALRTALRQSLRDFAEHLGVAARTVSKWEAGGVNVCPRPEMQAALDTALGRGGAEVQARFALLVQGDDVGDHGVPARLDRTLRDLSENGTFGNVIEWDAMSPLTRRLLLLQSIAAAAGPMVATDELSWVVATLGRAASSLSASTGISVGMSDVKRLQRAAARLHSLDQQHGGDILWSAALVQAHDGMQLLEQGSYTDSVGRHLLIAVGRLQICAGWLAFDAGQHEVARSCFTDALAMSQQADDAQTETRALANLALQSNALARPREGMRHAVGAEFAASGHGVVPWLAVIPQLRLAVGNSLTGNKRDADKAIATARRVLEHSGGSVEEWSSFLSPQEVDAIEATCAMELQQPARAERLFEQAIAGYLNKCTRNLALYRVRLARARLEAGTVDGAAEAAHAALDDLSGEVASWRVSHELDGVAASLRRYPGVQGVDSFIVRYSTRP